MAEASSVEQPAPTRDRLAWTIVVASIAGLLIVAAMAVTLGDAEMPDKVFMTLVPLFGTWVGTVLAYYFSKENFESASRSLREVVKQLSPDDQLSTIAVTKAMIAVDKIKKVDWPATGNPTQTVAELRDMLKAPVTRIPVLGADGAAKYVLHESLIYRFIANLAAGVDPKAKTLKDLVDDPVAATQVSKFAVVGEKATLLDAKTAMEKISGAQDVFVTADGDTKSKITGWLTNMDISKNMTPR
jgi:hypothetical protein